MNQFYDLGIKAIADADIDLLADDIQVQGVDSSYTPNYSTDQFLSGVTGLVGAAVSLTSKTTTAGRLLAANTTIAGYTGNAGKFVVIFKNTGAAATSPLIALLDTGTGLPWSANPSNILLVWDTGTNGIFRI